MDEPAQLCLRDENINMALILQGVHGPPTITPMPNSVPCSETLMCDPTRYDRVMEIYHGRTQLGCFSAGIGYLDAISPLQCDAVDSGLFLGGEGTPVKAYLCYKQAQGGRSPETP